MSNTLKLSDEDATKIWDMLEPLWKSPLKIGSSYQQEAGLFLGIPMSGQVFGHPKLDPSVAALQRAVNSIRFGKAMELTPEQADAIADPKTVFRHLARFVRENIPDNVATAIFRNERIYDVSPNAGVIADAYEQTAAAMPLASLVQLRDTINNLKREQGITGGRGAA